MKAVREPPTLVGLVLIFGGAYEALAPPLKLPTITELGKRYPELPGALIGTLIAHWFLPRQNHTGVITP